MQPKQSKSTIFVFNGDTDGICAARQLLPSNTGEYTFITGVKRDNSLLKNIFDEKQRDIYVLDIAIEKNLDALKRLLSSNCRIKWFDHHISPEIPDDKNLEAHIDTDSLANTSSIVARYLGQKNAWAVAGLYGDNIPTTAGSMARDLGLSNHETDQLQELGELMNYNAYGETVDDLHADPADLLKAATSFDDPLVFYRTSELIPRLKEGRQSDLQKAGNAEKPTENITIFPNEKWARRVIGIYANSLANQNPDQAHAVLVAKENGIEFTVSVRSPLTSDKSAAAFCRKFPTGGGRQKAAGINSLPEKNINSFIKEFQHYFKE